MFRSWSAIAIVGLLTWSPPAFAGKKFDCDWEGKDKDPFTLISDPWTGAIMFLLADGTIVSATPKAPSKGTPVTGNSSVLTIFQLSMELPKADAEKLSTATGVTAIRFAIPNGDWTMEFKSKDTGQIPGYATCAIAPDDTTK